MAATALHGAVLARFRKALNEMYGPPLDRVVLFGSRARGDGRPDSDYDSAVSLKSLSIAGAVGRDSEPNCAVSASKQRRRSRRPSDARRRWAELIG